MALSRVFVVPFLAFTNPPLRFRIATSPALTMAKRKQTTSVASASKAVSSKKKPKTAITTTAPATDTTSTTPWYIIFTKDDGIYNEYMATEWSFEKRGDNALFELLCLEGAQAGLSWRTILHKRDKYRQWFHDFDIDTVAAMTTAADVEAILAAPPESAIVRHRGKVESVIHNAKCVVTMRHEQAKKEENGDESTDNVLDSFLWSFVKDQPILNGHDWNGSIQGMPATTDESIAMSKALKAIGFKFVGPTTCYSLMQSAGMVIDHPMKSPEWSAAYERLTMRKGGFQDRRKSKK